MNGIIITCVIIVVLSILLTTIDSGGNTPKTAGEEIKLLNSFIPRDYNPHIDYSDTNFTRVPDDGDLRQQLKIDNNKKIQYNVCNNDKEDPRISRTNCASLCMSKSDCAGFLYESDNTGGIQPSLELIQVYGTPTGDDETQKYFLRGQAKPEYANKKIEDAALVKIEDGDKDDGAVVVGNITFSVDDKGFPQLNSNAINIDWEDDPQLLVSVGDRLTISYSDAQLYFTFKPYFGVVYNYPTTTSTCGNCAGGANLKKCSVCNIYKKGFMTYGQNGVDIKSMDIIYNRNLSRENVFEECLRNQASLRPVFHKESDMTNAECSNLCYDLMPCHGFSIEYTAGESYDDKGDCEFLLGDDSTSETNICDTIIPQQDGAKSLKKFYNLTYDRPV